ncbi:MAG: PIN domain-containing protein [Thioalkalivibrio sp.]|nr:PIN domain-containing protein [Thioalkalivibrio sp.]
MIHLDTSFVIHALTQGSTEDLALRFWIKAGTPLVMSAVAWAELLCGPLEGSHLALARHIVGDIAPFDAAHASLAAQLFNRSGRRRGSLADCMIAAAAISAQAALATANRADFTRFTAEGLLFVESAD